MSMQKYGVSDKAGQQKQELEGVKAELVKLNSSFQKTADQTQEVERLEKRAIELQIEIAEQ